ncbi:hypothetical protein ACQPXH_25130 [Nocardia sp. CA-135953]|uniref:hypothetical protein n=1 Tax=Nocardia sp. CA-135953 TaxID=3239978 RepID=UPI003D986061
MRSEWVGFFTTVVGIAGAIFALLFVGLQLGHGRWFDDPRRKLAAESALTELAAPLFVGLIAVIPGNPWRLGAVIVGCVGISVQARSWHGHLRTFSQPQYDVKYRAPGSFDKSQAWLGWLSFAVYAGLIVGGFHRVTWWPNGRTAPVFGFVTQDFGLYLIASLCIWLVMSGVTEAWALLVAKPR